MARALQVTIVESREQLFRRLDAQKTATGKERLQMLYWLKLGIVNTRARFSEVVAQERGNDYQVVGDVQEWWLGCIPVE